MKNWMHAFCVWMFSQAIFCLALFCLFYTNPIDAQTPTGSRFASPVLFVGDSLTDAPLAGATVEIEPLGSLQMHTVQTSPSGYYTFQHIKTGVYHIRVSNVGYHAYETEIPLNSDQPLRVKLERIDLFMQPIEVKALRAGDKTPFTKTDIDKGQIEKTNLGQDIPYLLDQTPSVVISSDAGNGVGYTDIFIRGTDDSRINMTLNGLPYNDPEEQQLFFVDIPDLASSTGSIQVERGVGTSSNGAGAFGATMNFSTNEFNDKAYGEASNSFGSYNTWKNSVRAGSGLIDGHYTIDARLSRISSDGFIDRATSDLKSLYFSTAYYSERSSLRFNVIWGAEKTYQAWNGIPQAKWDGDQAALTQLYQENVGYLYFTPQDSANLFNPHNNGTYNYFTYKNQTDNYLQNHYQLFFNHQFNKDLALNIAGFVTRGLGYYQEYHYAGDSANAKYTAYGLPPYIVGNDTLQSTDLIRQRWLDNYFYGGIFSLQYKKGGSGGGGSQLTLGGGWDRFNNEHYGNVIWAAAGGFPDDYQYYQEPADKTDFSIYAKYLQPLSPQWFLFADLQYRHIDYQIDGFDDNPSILVHTRYDFYNPKAGITYSHNNLEAYFSYSMASHEPDRDDFEAGATEQPRPEVLHDLELSVQKKNSLFTWGATAYYMQYHDQLVLTGKINDVGDYTRSNIPRSYRLGLELQGSVRPINWFSADANLTLSRNKVYDYTEYDYDNDNGGQVSYAYKITDIAFSPAVVGSGSFNFYPLRNTELSLLSKYVSKEYLDNAQQENRKLDGYYVQGLRAAYTIKKTSNKDFVNLIFQLNNAFNKRYASNGYTYSTVYSGQLVTDNFIFPMAGTNFMFAVNIKW